MQILFWCFGNINIYMKTVRQIFLLVISSTLHLFVFAQGEQVYIFQRDDSLLKNKYYEQALRNNILLLNSLKDQYKKDYKEIYETRFKDVSVFLKSSRAVTSPEAHTYLLAVYNKITEGNTLLKDMDVRLVFSRDWWPNAYSTGEGTLTINAGLMVFLNSEAELAFVLCHELADRKSVV